MPTLQAAHALAFSDQQVTFDNLPSESRRPACEILEMAKLADGYRLCLGNGSPWHIQQIDHKFILDRKLVMDIL